MRKKLLGNWRLRLSCAWLGLLLLMAVFADFWASDLPLYAKLNGKTYYPFFQADQTAKLPDPRTGETRLLALSQVDWHQIPTEHQIFTFARYGPHYVGTSALQSPLAPQFYTPLNGNKTAIPPHLRHRLGTDGSDRDVLAALIHGARNSLSVAVFSLLLLTFLGLGLGAWAAHQFGKQSQIHLLVLLFALLALFPAYFYGFHIRAYTWTFADKLLNGLSYLLGLLVFVGIEVLAVALARLIVRLSGLKFSLPFSVDSLLNFVADLKQSIPTLLLITLFSMAMQPGVASLVLMIGLTSYTGLYRFARLELARISQMPYMEAARSGGMGFGRTVFRHMLPNFYPLLLPVVVLGMADLIMLEASLSFLGMGLGIEEVSWGKMLNEARSHYTAWWLVLCPVVCIFLTSSSLYVIGNHLEKTK